jgi:hypothetical protein
MDKKKTIDKTNPINNQNNYHKREHPYKAQVVFDVEKVLKSTMPHIEINNFDPKKDMEKTKEFRKFLFYFNEVFDSKLDTDGIMYSRTNFKSFYDFIFFNVANRNVIIKKEILPEFMK